MSMLNNLKVIGTITVVGMVTIAYYWSSKSVRSQEPTNSKIEVQQLEDIKSNNKGWNYTSTKINDNTYKYKITLDGGEIDFSDFIALLKDKKKDFFQAFQGALKDANAKFSAYFWECSPVSKDTINKPFEFVVTKSISLDNISQDYSSFDEHFANGNEQQVVSFLNLGGDAILVVPIPQENLDYKNISQFTKNASDEQQQEFWGEVVDKLSKELEKSTGPRWLSTNGLGVHYLHVRIDRRPKYYSFWEYKKFERKETVNYRRREDFTSK